MGRCVDCSLSLSLNHTHTHIYHDLFPFFLLILTHLTAEMATICSRSSSASSCKPRLSEEPGTEESGGQVTEGMAVRIKGTTPADPARNGGGVEGGYGFDITFAVAAHQSITTFIYPSHLAIISSILLILPSYHLCFHHF